MEWATRRKGKPHPVTVELPEVSVTWQTAVTLRQLAAADELPVPHLVRSAIDAYVGRRLATDPRAREAIDV